MEPKKYTYNTSEKSYLDIIHDNFWESCASMIFKYAPSITPNMVTLSGFLSLLWLYVLYVSGCVTTSTFYFYLTFVLIFYLNTDAIDGKLARLSKRSSPYGQMIDHGCDAIALGIIAVSLLSDLSSSYFLRSTALCVLILSYLNQMFCNLTEFYTGRMIVSIGRYSTTELVYSCSAVSWFLFVAHYYNLNLIIGSYLVISRILITISSIIVLYKFYSSLITPSGLRKGTNKPSQKLKYSDIYQYLIASLLVSVIAYHKDFSFYELSVSIMYISSFMIDIIFSNSIKLDKIHYDYRILIVLCIKMFVVVFNVSVFRGFWLDVLSLVLFFDDKKTKRDYIFSHSW